MTTITERCTKARLENEIMDDLKSAATRIEILEEELHAERAKKWNAVRKLKILKSEGGWNALEGLLDKGEALTLHDKIEHIKNNWVA